MLHRLASRAAAMAAILSFATSILAQVAQHESMTDWKHAGTAPNWTDDVPHPGAEFGKVDQLNSIVNLSWTSNPILLSQGTYTANCRLMKFQDGTGVAPLDFVVLINGNPTALTTLDAAAQTVDQFVRTPTLTFSVNAPGTMVSFLLLNTDANITKQNYYFDSFLVGDIDVGAVMLVQSMGRQWLKSWGGPYFNGMVPDTGSIFGYAEELAFVWWLDWHSRAIVLQPGTYTANIRAKKTVGTNGAFDIDVIADVGGVAHAVSWTYAQQVAAIDQYQWTDDLVFDVVQPNTNVVFKFENILTRLRKADYRFDAFILRKGAYSISGTGCPSSLGPVTLSGNPPQLGEIFTVKAHNVPSNGAMLYGVRPANVSLGVIGMPGCAMLVDSFAALGLMAVNGVAESQVIVPNDPALSGAAIFNQAVVADPGQNARGLVVSDRGKGEISN